jgi:hypothetical protein
VTDIDLYLAQPVEYLRRQTPILSIHLWPCYLSKLRLRRLSLGTKTVLAEIDWGFELKADKKVTRFKPVDMPMTLAGRSVLVLNTRGLSLFEAL